MLCLPARVAACLRWGGAGQQGGRPTWTWSAPLFVTVAAAGLGLTLGFSEIGEKGGWGLQGGVAWCDAVDSRGVQWVGRWQGRRL
jgi:hypothetical protein